MAQHVVTFDPVTKQITGQYELRGRLIAQAWNHQPKDLHTRHHETNKMNEPKWTRNQQISKNTFNKHIQMAKTQGDSRLDTNCEALRSAQALKWPFWIHSSPVGGFRSPYFTSSQKIPETCSKKTPAIPNLYLNHQKVFKTTSSVAVSVCSSPGVGRCHWPSKSAARGAAHRRPFFLGNRRGGSRRSSRESRPCRDVTERVKQS